MLSHVPDEDDEVDVLAVAVREAEDRALEVRLLAEEAAGAALCAQRLSRPVMEPEFAI